jgi:hypothetical protein
MIVTITVEAEHAAEEIRSLDQELVDLDELRGAVRRVAGSLQPGELGVLDSGLVIALAQGGAATAMATVLVAWLRRRVGNVSVKLTRPGGAVVEVSAGNVRAMDADQVKLLVTELSATLETEPGSGASV